MLNIAAADFLAGSAPLLSHFVVVLIVCCIISVEYLQHMQCYKVALLQHLTVAEYYTYSFPADFIPIPSYYISVLIFCYIPSAEYLTHMQCS